MNELSKKKYLKYKQKYLQLKNQLGGNILINLEGHKQIVNDVVFHPKLPLFASCSGDRNIKLWSFSDDVKKTVCVSTIEGKFIVNCPITSCNQHTNWVNSLAFHPDKLLLVSASSDATVKLWSFLQNGTEPKFVANLSVIDNGGKVNSVSFHPSGDFIATGNENMRVKLWNLASDNSVKLVNTLEGHTNSVNLVKFHLKTNLLASSSNESVRLWKLNDDKKSATYKVIWQNTNFNVNPLSFTFHPNLLLLAISASDKTIDLYSFSQDGSTFTIVKQVKDSDNSYSVAFNQNFPLLATGNLKKAKLWLYSEEDKTVTLHKTLDFSDKVTHIAFNPNGNILATCFDKTIGLCKVKYEKQDLLNEIRNLSTIIINYLQYCSTSLMSEYKNFQTNLISKNIIEETDISTIKKFIKKLEPTNICTDKILNMTAKASTATKSDLKKDSLMTNLKNVEKFLEENKGKNFVTIDFLNN